MPSAEETVSVEVAEVVVGDSITLVGFGRRDGPPEDRCCKAHGPRKAVGPSCCEVECLKIPEVIVTDAGLGAMLSLAWAL